MNKSQIQGSIVLCLLVILALSSRLLYDKHMEKEYDKLMRSEDKCVPCAFLDEEAGTFTDWTKDDYEFKGLPFNDDTGFFEPLKDRSGKIIKDLPNGYPGTKSLHIPFIRGFQFSDYVGVMKCRPCREAKVQMEIDACNDREGYKALYADVPLSERPTVEDLDGAHPAEQPMKGQ